MIYIISITDLDNKECSQIFTYNNEETAIKHYNRIKNNLNNKSNKNIIINQKEKKIISYDDIIIIFQENEIKNKYEDNDDILNTK